MEATNDRLTALAARAAQGDGDAFNELYRLTRDRAYFVAYSVTRSEQDALDILQDSYLKAWQNCAGLKNPAVFTAWLHQIVGNTAKDFIKKRRPQLFEPLEGDDDPLALQPERDAEYIPDAAMDTAETRRLIMGIIDALPEDQRLCVLLYYYDDMPVADIAHSLELQATTVKNRLALARKKISKAVEELERSGKVKLYGAAPIPLLVWLLRSACVPLPPAILAAPAATAAATATSAASVGGTAAAVVLPVKIIAAIAAAVIATGGAVAAVKHLPKAPAEVTVPTVAVAAAADASPEPLSRIAPDTSEPTKNHASTSPYTQAARPGAAETGVPAASTAPAVAATTVAPSTGTAAVASTTRYVYMQASAPSTTRPSTATEGELVSITAPASPATQAETRLITKSSNGVAVIWSEDVLSEDAALVVLPNMWDTMLMNGAETVGGWSIQLMRGGAAVQPSGDVTVRLQIPATFTGDPAALSVYHSVGGEYRRMDAQAQGGAMVFLCSQF